MIFLLKFQMIFIGSLEVTRTAVATSIAPTDPELDQNRPIHKPDGEV